MIPVRVFGFEISSHLRLKPSVCYAVIGVVAVDAHRDDVLLDAEPSLRSLYVVAIGSTRRTAYDAPASVPLPDLTFDFLRYIASLTAF